MKNPFIKNGEAVATGTPVLSVRLAGNPNVGKSTVFNALTGLHQHTGNWAGKTVCSAEGACRAGGVTLHLVDTPGAYSLLARSAEETVTRDRICFAEADATVVVCDATALSRGMNLALQILEAKPHTVLCVNLMDEAEKKGLHLDLHLLETRLGIPVVGVSARSRRGLPALVSAIRSAAKAPKASPTCVTYPAPIEAAVAQLAPVLAPLLPPHLHPRWAALRLLEGDRQLLAAMDAYAGTPIADHPAVARALRDAQSQLAEHGIPASMLPDALVAAIYERIETLLAGVVRVSDKPQNTRQLSIDRLLTGRLVGIPVMLLLLVLVFYLTIAGANVPSALLSDLFSKIEAALRELLPAYGIPPFFVGLLVTGMLRTLFWVIAVMLPPMAIFFPLFTLLEDLGYLPRIAFNLDRRFRRCGGCGKQALCMWVVDMRMQRGYGKAARKGGDGGKETCGETNYFIPARSFSDTSYWTTSSNSLPRAGANVSYSLCKLLLSLTPIFLRVLSS